MNLEELNAKLRELLRRTDAMIVLLEGSPQQQALQEARHELAEAIQVLAYYLQGNQLEE